MCSVIFKMTDSNKASQRSKLIDYLCCQSFSCHKVNSNNISDKTTQRLTTLLIIQNDYVESNFKMESHTKLYFISFENKSSLSHSNSKAPPCGEMHKFTHCSLQQSLWTAGEQSESQWETGVNG